MFPWETETIQQARAVAAAPSGPENAGNVPCSPNVSFADILGGGVKHVPANELESLQAHQATRRAQREAQQALRVSACREADLRAEKEAEVLRACYQHVPVAGGRMPVRTEHTGISDHPSTRVHAAPGGNSSLSLSDGSVPEASRRAQHQQPHQQQPHQQQQQQAASAPLHAAAEQHATEQHAAASAIRERARGGSSLW